MKGSVFKYYNCHFKGRPRPEPWRSWRDLILQRVPAVVTAPNGASPQSKHCNPPIPSHSRISQLVPPEYGGNLGRGKIGTQTGVIFAAPWEFRLQFKSMFSATGRGVSGSCYRGGGSQSWSRLTCDSDSNNWIAGAATRISKSSKGLGRVQVCCFRL